MKKTIVYASVACMMLNSVGIQADVLSDSDIASISSSSQTEDSDPYSSTVLPVEAASEIDSSTESDDPNEAVQIQIPQDAEVNSVEDSSEIEAASISQASAEITIDADSIDTQEGSFRIRISNLYAPNGVKEIQVPVWGEIDDQNDLIWYTAQKEGNDYFVTVNASDHNFESGTYIIHCYLTDKSGKQSFLCSTETELSFASALKAELSSDEKTISVTATGIHSSASNVSFAVWSDENGQDDLVWVNASKSKEGNWVASLPVKGHKNTGLYYIHCYQNINGKNAFFRSSEVTISSPSVQVSVDEDSINTQNGTFKVRISNLNIPAGVKKVMVPIWGDVNGQNDLIWYTAQKEGSDYVVMVDTSKHDYEEGLYNIHCYVTDGNDIQNMAGSTSLELTTSAKNLTAELSDTQQTILVSANGINKKASSVSFAIWSDENGQDDLVWITASKDKTGHWSASVPVKGHNNSRVYYIHCYQTVNKKSSFFDDTEVTISTAQAAISIENKDNVNGSFQVRISNLKVPAGVKKVQVPVWGDTNGQNDLIWYDAEKDGNDYIVNVSIADHNFETGLYNVHLYITDNNDIRECTAISSVEISHSSGLSISLSEDEMTAHAAYFGKSAASLRAAVWSEQNGQDDLVWYDMSSNTNGKYVNIPISSHKTAGKYYVHIYSGNSFLCSGEFEVSDVSAKASVSKTDNKNGTFRITISDIGCASGVSSVSVPVWVGSNQSKIYWYTAKKASDGSYYVDVDVKNHKYTFGNYTAHVYIYGKNGIGKNVCKASASLTAKNFIYTESISSNKTRVWITGTDSSVKSVSFPTWSKKNDQDDLVWYAATKSGNAWYADIDSSRHKHEGIYYTHCYTYNSSGTGSFVGGTSYTLSFSAKDAALYSKKERDSAIIANLLTYNSRPDIYDGNIDFIRAAKNIVTDESKGYGHTWPKTISCAGLVGLTLTYCGYGDFVKADPLGWSYIDLGDEYEATLINECRASWNAVTINGLNYARYLQPGDLLYTYTNQFENHIAIYAGNGYTIEARGPSGATDADDTGVETGIYYMPVSSITYQGFFRLPNLHTLN